MQAKSTTAPTTLSVPASTTAPPAMTATTAPARRLTRRERTLQMWNRVALAVVGLGLLYMAGCLALVQAPADQPQLPGLMAGFGIAPLIGLLFAYLVTRAELTRR